MISDFSVMKVKFPWPNEIQKVAASRPSFQLILLLTMIAGTVHSAKKKKNYQDGTFLAFDMNKSMLLNWSFHRLLLKYQFFLTQDIIHWLSLDLKLIFFFLIVPWPVAILVCTSWLVHICLKKNWLFCLKILSAQEFAKKIAILINAWFCSNSWVKTL